MRSFTRFLQTASVNGRSPPPQQSIAILGSIVQPKHLLPASGAASNLGVDRGDRSQFFDSNVRPKRLVPTAAQRAITTAERNLQPPPRVEAPSAPFACDVFSPLSLLGLGGRVEYAGAMRATRGTFLDFLQAIRAHGRSLGGFFFLARKLVAQILSLVYRFHE